MNTCPDGGTCHHKCLVSCYRVECCGPLSGVFENDEWPTRWCFTCHSEPTESDAGINWYSIGCGPDHDIQDLKQEEPELGNLTKTTSVLPMAVFENGVVTYGERDADISTSMSAETWRDMGKPDELTVTIRPGDNMNADGS